MMSRSERSSAMGRKHGSPVGLGLTHSNGQWIMVSSPWGIFGPCNFFSSVKEVKRFLKPLLRYLSEAISANWRALSSRQCKPHDFFSSIKEVKRFPKPLLRDSSEAASASWRPSQAVSARWRSAITSRLSIEQPRGCFFWSIALKNGGIQSV